MKRICNRKPERNMTTKYHNYSFYNGISQIEYIKTKKSFRTLQTAGKIEQTFAKNVKFSISRRLLY